MSDEYLLVYCTCPDLAAGKRIAGALVEARLAACVNLVPGVESVYRWEGRIESSAECLVVIKSARRVLAQLQERIVEMHPYELPEIVAVPISSGLGPYLTWIEDSLIDA